MIRVITITQLVFLALGVMALKIIVKSTVNTDHVSTFVLRLDEYGLWVFIVPLIWTIYGNICLRVDKGAFSLKIAQVTGVAIAAIILGCFAWGVFFPGVG